MRIYRYWADGDKFKCLRMVNEERWAFGYSLDGRRVGHEWTPIEVEIEKWKRTPDFYGLYLVPVLNQRALQVFEPLLGERVEVLPLEVKGSKEKLFLLNVLDILDCLDYERATYEPRGEDLPPRIKTYRFKSGCIGDRLIFRLRETWRSETLITESFVKVAVEHGLRGLRLNSHTLLDDVS